MDRSCETYYTVSVPVRIPEKVVNEIKEADLRTAKALLLYYLVNSADLFRVVKEIRFPD